MNFQKPGQSRAFAFDLEIAVGDTSLGIELNPEMGMLVNLSKVDEALAALQKFWSGRQAQSLQELLDLSLQELKTQFKDEASFSGGQVSLQRLCLREKRGWYFGWEQTYFHGFTDFKESSSGLLKVTAQFPGKCPWALDDVLRPLSDWVQNTDVELKARAFPVPMQELASSIWKTHSGLAELTVEHCGSGEQLRVKI